MDGAGLVNMPSSRPSISSEPSSPGRRQRMPRSQSGSKPVSAIPLLKARLRPPPPAASFPFGSLKPSLGAGGGATSGWTVMSGLQGGRGESELSLHHLARCVAHRLNTESVMTFLSVACMCVTSEA